MRGYPRSDGRIGIRNVVAVVYLVECARHVADRIVRPFDDIDDVHLIGFPGCFRNDYAQFMLERICTHPNVGAVLICSLGCEGFDRDGLAATIAASGRPVETVVIQGVGGTNAAIDAGRAWVRGVRDATAQHETVPMSYGDLVVGTICGGSDSTSGMTANPAVGHAFDLLVDRGATAIFEETGELMGCEPLLEARAANDDVKQAISDAMDKAAKHYADLGQPSFAPGNAEGGLTTIEEKSLGAYAKSGSRPIAGVVTPAQPTAGGGVYLLDVVPDGPTRWGFANINDNAEAAELIACGAHMILFTTGRGSVVGSAIAPIIKICANPETYERMTDDMDVNAGAVLSGETTVRDVGDQIDDLVSRVAAGERTASERLGHREFIMTYKSFEPIGPSCHPG